jgi:hypothetical protein
MMVTIMASTSFTDCRSFLISRRIGFDRAFLPSKKTRSIPYRAKVLGRALLSAYTDANRFWILLSGNAEVTFPSTTATIAVAANLPNTPTTAAADLVAVALLFLPLLLHPVLLHLLLVRSAGFVLDPN